MQMGSRTNLMAKLTNDTIEINPSCNRDLLERAATHLPFCTSITVCLLVFLTPAFRVSPTWAGF